MGAMRAAPKVQAKAKARASPPPAILLAAASQVLAKAQAAVASKKMPPDVRVHRVRVALKRLRTYWRLARAHVAPGAWARERDRLRGLAAELARFRDVDVAVAVAASGLVKSANPSDRDRVRSWVEGKHARTEVPPSRDQALSRVVRRMLGVPGKLLRATDQGGNWEWMKPGLKRAYRHGQRGHLDCRKGGGDLAFHAWRRRVKDLQYQVELVRAMAPRPLGKALRRIHRMADALGDAHDLVDLRDHLQRPAAAKQPSGPAAAQQGPRQALPARADRRIAAKYREALREAASVYAAPTKEWLRALRKEWLRWERRQTTGRKHPNKRPTKLT